MVRTIFFGCYQEGHMDKSRKSQGVYFCFHFYPHFQMLTLRLKANFLFQIVCGIPLALMSFNLSVLLFSQVQDLFSAELKGCHGLSEKMMGHVMTFPSLQSAGTGCQRGFCNTSVKRTLLWAHCVRKKFRRLSGAATSIGELLTEDLHNFFIPAHWQKCHLALMGSFNWSQYIATYWAAADDPSLCTLHVLEGKKKKKK